MLITKKNHGKLNDEIYSYLTIHNRIDTVTWLYLLEIMILKERKGCKKGKFAMAVGIRAEDASSLGAFIDLSKEIGSDILKTQGAGGNTSFKQNGIMWVKASGTWLAHAGERDIMVPVTVAPLVAALRANDPRAEKSIDFVVTELNATGLRPSIETSFHAVLPQRIVAHYHCVNAIALSVLVDRDRLIAERMAKVPDLTWVTIPYRRPGTPLAHEIDRVAARRPDVLILYNHGIIVTGETVDDVRERITRVTDALAINDRPATTTNSRILELMAEGSEFHAASDAQSHKTALSPANVAAATGDRCIRTTSYSLARRSVSLLMARLQNPLPMRAGRQIVPFPRWYWCRVMASSCPTN